MNIMHSIHLELVASLTIINKMQILLVELLSMKFSNNLLETFEIYLLLYYQLIIRLSNNIEYMYLSNFSIIQLKTKLFSQNFHPL